MTFRDYTWIIVTRSTYKLLEFIDKTLFLYVYMRDDGYY